MKNHIPIYDGKIMLPSCILLQNRHSKTTKESGADDTEMMLADSSSKASGSMYD
jgi:hypothetical protein